MQQSAEQLAFTAGLAGETAANVDRIAAQTNLLAVNATIEAARAGDHRRGFAVVANEVKELSRNCAKATSEISQQVEMMQGTVGQVAQFIGSVNATISTIDQSAVGIAQWVNEQVQATGDISRNLSQASQNTSKISERIGGGKREARKKAGNQAA